MGHKDGTNNLHADDVDQLDQHVWVGDEGPTWMRGGSYLVVRRIRMHLEAWDRATLGEQEQTIGRHKSSGAPLGGTEESSPVDLDATDQGGQSLIRSRSTGTPPTRWLSMISVTSPTVTPPYHTCSG